MTTEIDIAHARMEEDPENDQARLQFYERLADSELFLLLAEEATGETLKPEVFPVEDQSFVLVFDRPDRLAEFVGKPALCRDVWPCARWNGGGPRDRSGAEP